MEKQLETSVQTAIAFLEEQGYRYAIIGGIALAQWNVIRATYDVDIEYQRLLTQIKNLN